MALYRPSNICPFCKETIKEIYQDQSHLPPMMQLIGDTFLEYENHKCPEGTKIPSPMDNMNEEQKVKFLEMMEAL